MVDHLFIINSPNRRHKMYEYKAIVDRVVDGDTIDLDVDLGFDIWLRKQRIRLRGVDAPESRTRDRNEKKFGMLSKLYVMEHCPVGSEVILQTYLDGRGKFGRILGEIFLSDQELSLNELMINDKMAVYYHGQSKEDVNDEHLANRQFLIETGTFKNITY